MKYTGRLIWILIGLSNITFAQTQPKYSYDDLEATGTQKRVEQFVTQFLSNYHYQKFTLDDSLSSRIYDNFINDVDGSHSYFTRAEIDNFEKYRYTFDESLISGDLTAAFDIFNTYRKIYRDRHEFIMNLLDKPFDFTTNDTYSVDRKNKEWAGSISDLNKEWDKIVLSQALSLKLSGSADTSIVKTLKTRYERYESRVAKWRTDDIFQTFMNSFTEAIDPHTSYMVPSAAAEFNIEMSQSLEGIGASLRNEGDYVMIADIIPGGPLFKTEQANKEDYILSVAQGDDGEFQEIIGWLTNDAVKLIRGKKGTVVRLMLKAKEAPQNSAPREVRIVREKIKLEEAVASSEILEINQNNKDYRIGFIDIPMFYRDFDGARNGGDFQSTTKDVQGFLEKFKKEDIDGVIIDLRNNGGGSLTEAISLTGLFINNGPVVQRKTGKGKIDVENDRDPSLVYDGPLLILQNRFSASASEIFAGAIQDYKRGIIIGEQSFGKGTVQQLVNLDQFLSSPRVASRNGVATSGQMEEERFGQLKLTTEKFYRITGNSTQLKGVMPDLALPSPYDSEESGESSRPTALAYDEIESASFRPVDNVNEEVMEFVVNRHQDRLKTDSTMIELLSEIEEYNAMKDIKEYSLNYEQRLKEKEENDKKNSAIKMLRKQKEANKRDADLYLKESEKIMIDFIEAQKI